MVVARLQACDSARCQQGFYMRECARVAWAIVQSSMPKRQNATFAHYLGTTTCVMDGWMDGWVCRAEGSLLSGNGTSEIEAHVLGADFICECSRHRQPMIIAMSMITWNDAS
eukprot:1161401-Pelagomonas_calceolata.AAC.16